MKMKVSELIEHLEQFHDDLPVYVRVQNDYASEVGYWEITSADIQGGDVRDIETGKEDPAVIIGDDRI